MRRFLSFTKKNSFVYANNEKILICKKKNIVMLNEFINSYIAPQVEVIETVVEVGFANSSNVEDPIEDDIKGWN